jgi:alkylation response protein AidB-like acyl-CoA dehydrogenase
MSTVETEQMRGEDRVALANAVRGLVDDLAPLSRVRESAEAGEASEHWWRALTEMGLTGLLVPGEYGGSGGTHAEVSAVMAELGRTLADEGFLSTVALVTPALAAADDEELLRRVAAGGRGAIALHEGSVTATAADSTARMRLTGAVDFVLDAQIADFFLIEATGVDGPTLVAVEADDADVHIEHRRTLDLTRGQARLSFDGALGRVVGAPGGAAALTDASVTMGSIALAAEQTAISREMLRRAVEYAGQRVQFGSPIGSYQAVKHLCAEMLIRTELAQAAVEHIADAAADAPEISVDAAVALHSAHEAAVYAATQGLHVHGGIGFTWEHDAHLYYRRAHADATVLGPDAAGARRLFTALGLSSTAAAEAEA